MIRLLLILVALAWSESFNGDFSRSRCSVFSRRRFSNEHDCSRYYKCFYGLIRPKMCPFGKIFDCKLRSCTKVNLTMDTSCCTFRNHAVGESCFALDIVAPNFFDCTTYFRCIKWRIAKYSCPDEMKFNFLINNCVNGSLLVPCFDKLVPQLFSVVGGLINQLPAIAPQPNFVDDNFLFGI